MDTSPPSLSTTDPAWITDIATQWPAFAWLVPLMLVAFYVAKFLSVAHEPVAKLFGALGRSWRDSAARKQKAEAGEVGLLRGEVASLAEKVDGLQKRDEIYWAYVMYDEEWHRKDDFAKVQAGLIPGGHLSFLEFRAKWIRERYKHNEFKDETTW